MKDKGHPLQHVGSSGTSWCLSGQFCPHLGGSPRFPPFVQRKGKWARARTWPRISHQDKLWDFLECTVRLFAVSFKQFSGAKRGIQKNLPVRRTIFEAKNEPKNAPMSHKNVNWMAQNKMAGEYEMTELRYAIGRHSWKGKSFKSFLFSLHVKRTSSEV